MRPALPMPAQLIRIRATPFLLLASLIAASALAESDTSHLIAMPPISFACALAASMLTSSNATFAPALASSAAVAAPSPEPPPVTIAACPLMSILVFPPFGIFNQQRDALPTPNAGGGNAIAQAGAFELARKSNREAHAGRAERMADGDRAAVHVELFFVKTERARAGHHLRAERFVDLEAVDIGEMQAGLLNHGLDCRHGADPHDFGRHARGRAREQPCERLLVLLFGIIRRSHQRRGRAVHDGRGIAAGLHTAEGGTDFRQRFHRRLPNMRIVIDRFRVAPQFDPAWIVALAREFFRLHRRDLAGEEAALFRLHGALE